MQEQMYIPEGGVASFLTSNMDEMPDNVLAFGQARGINSMDGVANRMAQMGRNGDTEMAHVNRDEIIIDRNMARDPRIRNAMAEVFSDNDMDMSRYTVGNAANSVNPYTGNKEFFLKKIISGVKKIVKMAAPIVIPLAMNAIFPGMGALASGFIGSGISSLAQGNSFKDSMKAGVMGGLVGGIGQGFRNMKAGDGFLSGGGFGGNKDFKFFDRNQNFKNTLLKGEAPRGGTAPISTNLAASPDTGGGNYSGSNAKSGSTVEDSNFFKDMFYEQKQDAASFLPEGVSFKDASGAAQSKAMALAAKSGGIKLAPTIGAGLALAAPLGLYDSIPAAELDDPYNSPSPAEDRLAANPEKYTTGIPGAPSYRSLYDVMVPSVRKPIYQQFIEPVQTAASGGEMQNFPRKTGYIGGPGTETSDSIPAMLSDGEFVMNAKAVRGAGGGSREQGVRKMYDMMRAFEGGAVA